MKILGADGTTRTHNKKEVEEIGTHSLAFQPGTPTTFDFIPKTSGRYTFTVTGKDSSGHPTRTASTLYVYGEGVYPWASEQGMRIKLVSEKKRYQVGDTAKLLVMTPIEGTALVTVERQNVIEHFQVELKSNNPVIEFPISEALAPNAFVSVLLIRGADMSPESTSNQPSNSAIVKSLSMTQANNSPSHWTPHQRVCYLVPTPPSKA
ncbi:hypothetical protein [Rubritalea tangerina]|uniref:hypothetical protein n=1 Tax=Rubritalea tangerina TaxID=430798 RepID=UPI00360DDBC0